jgi:uncharacterized membrane protein
VTTYLEHLIYWLKFAAEASSVILIGFGITFALFHLIRTLLNPSLREYQRTRLSLSRFLILALEFQLASDILGTAISPSWNELGQLAVIATIRTVLNFFLTREMKEEEGYLRVNESRL